MKRLALILLAICSISCAHDPAVANFESTKTEDQRAMTMCDKKMYLVTGLGAGVSCNSDGTVTATCDNVPMRFPEGERFLKCP